MEPRYIKRLDIITKPSYNKVILLVPALYTVEARYNEDLGTIKITLLYQVSHYIRVKKQRNIKSWDQQNCLVITGFCCYPTSL